MAREEKVKLARPSLVKRDKRCVRRLRTRWAWVVRVESKRERSSWRGLVSDDVLSDEW